MSKQFATVAVMAALCLALVGCGSDGPNLRPELEKLTEQVEKQTKQLEQVQDDFDTERDTQEELLEEQLEKAREETEEAEREAEAERQRREAADRRVQQAQEQARQAEKVLKANQKSEELLEKLKAENFTDVSADNGRVSISVPKRNSLTFEKRDYTARTLSAPGLRGARLTRSRGGTQTVVVYTDIKLSRSLIETYASAPDATTVEFPLSAVGTVADFNFLADDDAVTISRSVHGFPSTRAVNTTPPPVTIGTFKGSLHGVSGTFLCDGDCTLMADYGTAGNKLTKVTLDNDLKFKPDSRTVTVPFCDAPRSQCAPTDTNYMAFGWWREESAQGAYEFGPFIAGGETRGEVNLEDTAPTDVKAEYNGMAVGMYVEQDQVGTTAVTKKQGEFTADVRLDYDATLTALTGTIDSFKTTPTGDSGAPATADTWVVELEGSSAVLQRRGGDGVGTWRYQYVSDGSAVVGIFESGVPDVLHLVGAFGAK